MEQNKYYENYPFSTVCICSGQTILSYILGTWILFLVNEWLGFGYILLWLFSLLISMKLRCCYCYYYGRTCSFSLLSKLAGMIFNKGDPQEFKSSKKVMPVAAVSFIVSLLPLVGGVILNIMNFSWLNVLLLGVYILSAFLVSFPIRGSLSCKHCKQGELGCPAYRRMTRDKNPSRV